MDKEQNQEYQDRLARLQKLREQGVSGYESKFDRSHTLSELRDLAEGTEVSVAGRVMTLRRMGKIGFGKLQDHTGTFQIVARQGDTPDDVLEFFNELLDGADIVGVKGTTFVTERGEPSVMVKEFTILTKALLPLPEKWHGLQDKEEIYRRRYLDTLSNRESFERFQFRSKFVQELRQFYWQEGFVEIETPILQNTASGALAKPFVTHHNAYDTDIFLRIAPEIHLKEAIIGGFDKVFEIGRVFRNEGTDPSHLQDFTMVEHYAAYWNYEDNMSFMQRMLQTVIEKLHSSFVVEIPDADGEITAIDFSGEWPRKSIRELILEYTEIDIDEHTTVTDLLKAIEEKGIILEKTEGLGRGNLIDTLYKKTVRPHILGPIFLIDHPTDLSPLARQKDDDSEHVERFQILVNGWEVANGYSELADPQVQAKRFEEQQKARQGGDEEAMEKDDEFIEALEHGLPPTSGMGMGIDRIVALLTKQPNLRDVVLFPLMRPRDGRE